MRKFIQPALTSAYVALLSTLTVAHAQKQFDPDREQLASVVVDAFATLPVRVVPVVDGASASLQQLLLEVHLNGETLQTLLQVKFDSTTHRLLVSRDDWRRLGLVERPEEFDATGRVDVSRMKDVDLRVDTIGQRLWLNVPASRFALRTYDMFGQSNSEATAAPVSAVFNYDIFGQYNRLRDSTASRQAAGFFSGRFSGQWGSIDQSFTAQSQVGDGGPHVRRLDSSYRYFDRETLTSWQVGDAISAGLNTLPAIRFAGLQWRRDFSLRPDLVTFPVPSFNGSSAVPTAVDLYVDQFRRSQMQVAPGPFTINQLPVVVGPNQVQVVLTDVLGRQQITTLNFFASAQLLAPGLSDFAAQAGFARTNYAQAGDGYDHHPLAIGSYRYGWSNALTLETQAEAASGFGLLSVGGASLLGSNGTVGLDAAVSRNQSKSGGRISGNLNYYFGPRLILNGTFSQATTNFRDVSQVRTNSIVDRSSQTLTLSQGFGNSSTVGLSYVRQVTQQDDRFSSLTLSAGQNVSRDGYVGVSAWHTLENRPDWGATVSLTWFLGERRSASASVLSSRAGSTGTLAVQSSLPMDSGWGWNVQVSQGLQDIRRGEVLNRNRVSDLSALVEDNSAGQYGRLGAIGALAWIPGTPVLAGRTISDSFAVVDLGYPDVHVFSENRPIGTTDASGVLLVNGLNAYQSNKLSFEALDLPLNLIVGDAERHVVPARGTGLRVNFDVRKDDSVLLALTHTDGSRLSPGARLVLPDGTQRTVGYDGLVLIPSTLAGMSLDVMIASQSCRLRLPAPLAPDQQHSITLKPICQ